MAVHKNGVKQGGAPKLDDCLTPDDNTDLDASTARHGLLLKLGGGTTNFLRADGSWAAPPGAAGGEANTASNQGSGTAVFIQKTGVDLEFNAIKSENNRLSVALDGVTHDVELTVNEANIDHDALANFAADEHFTEASIDHTAITNIGTNSHADVDTHIAATTGHGATGAVVGTTNTQTLTNKTLTTPTIGSFANSAHDHADAAGGGTITSASVSDFDTEVGNHTDVAANTAHRTSNGTEHTYINQSIVSGASPTFDGTNFSGIPASALPDADDDGVTKGVCTFNNDDFNATTGVVTINDAGVDHDSLTNTHNLTTDIDHDALTNYSADEHFTEASIDHANITAGNGADHTYIDQDVTTSGTPTFSTVTATTVNATTLDTNVAAAGVTLAGTTLAADGTDTHIDVSITPKGNAGIVLPSTSPPAVTTNKLYNNAGVLTFDGVSLESGGGDFTGPGSSTDNAIVRFDGTGGKTGQNSGITIDDSNNMTMAGELDMNSQDIDNAKTVTFIAEVDDGNSGAADTIDWTTGQKHKSTLTANCTYTFTAPQGPCNLLLKVVQDGTGSRTVTWPATVKWPTNGTAPTLSTGASDVDIITFYYDGTNYYGVASLDFA